MSPIDPGPVPLLGSAGSGLRFELALNPAEGEEEPFVALSDSGRFSRVLLARIVLGEETTLRPLAFKLQRNSYRPTGAGALPVTNPQIDEQWSRERRNLQVMPPDEDAVVRLLDFGDANAVSRPVTFCRKAKKYFHPPCPSCGKLLEDCRDEPLLRDLGLASYAAGATRYLYCAPCAKKKPVFYSYSLTPEEQPKGSVTIRRRAELYRDHLALARKGALPCSDDCYPADAKEGDPVPAEKFHVPVSYYEFHSVPMELLQLHYDEFVDLLGGADWGTLKQSVSPARRDLLSILDASFSAGFQWAYRGDTSGLFAVEVLRLKLIAFTQLCRGLRALHARAKQPHLDLSPAGVMVSIPEPARELPTRWNFKVKLIDVASAQRFPPAEPLGGAFLPPTDYDKTYSSPILRQTTFGNEQPVRVTIKSLKGDAELVPDRVKLQESCPRDLVRIIPTGSVSWLENAQLWGTITGSAEKTIRLNAILPPGAKAPVTFEARAAFYRRYHVPCDLYSVGMMLLRTILVDDEQDMFAVEEAVERILNKLAVGLQDRREPDFNYVANSLTWLVDAEKEVFDKKAVVWSKDDRAGGRSLVPDSLWSSLLQFAFRLVSNIPGFSFCANHGDFDPARPDARMGEVMSVLDEFNARLHVELFGRAARDREILETCDEVQAELSGAKPQMESAEFES